VVEAGGVKPQNKGEAVTEDTEGTRGRRRRRRAGLAIAVGATAVEAVVVTKRRGSLFGAETVVRCRDGHLFTTLWIPGASFKAIRLGWWRFQRCPVGQHWDLVTPVDAASLSQEEKHLAAERHDLRIP
jgi:hypothetical protein